MHGNDWFVFSSNCIKKEIYYCHYCTTTANDGDDIWGTYLQIMVIIIILYFILQKMLFILSFVILLKRAKRTFISFHAIMYFSRIKICTHILNLKSVYEKQSLLWIRDYSYFMYVYPYSITRILLTRSIGLVRTSFVIFIQWSCSIM